MGSSKKHKEKDREGKKKKKHRSRSRSRDRESRKRKHKDRDSRSRSPPNKAGRSERDQHVSLEREEPEAKQVFDYGHQRSQPQPVEDAAPTQVSGDGSSLSIEETNRLRAKLGLKPLDLPDAKGGEDGKPEKKEGVHKPAINIGEMQRSEKIREKLETRKRQRELKEKLSKTKGLGDSDSEGDDAMAWVKRSRKVQKEREMAEKRAKMLEEMDQDFGVSGLVEQEMKPGQGRHYTSQDLSGLTVEHKLDKFDEGRRVILTLKDKGILDEDGDDVLVNVNIEDDERAEKNVENMKKKPDYKPYDEPQYDEYGLLKPSNLLEKYDEEIDGVKKESFQLGSSGSYDAAHEKRMAEIRKELKARGESLLTPKPTLASEYLTPEEVKAAATFKKTKKKVRKIRKKDVLKADDLLPLPDQSTADDYGSRARGRGRQEVKEEGEAEDEPAFSSDLAHGTARRPPPPPPPPGGRPPKPDPDQAGGGGGAGEDLAGVLLEEEEAQAALQAVLDRARRLKAKRERKERQLPVAIKQEVDMEEDGGDVKPGLNMVLNSTSEFCRNLGDIPTYGLSGNRAEDRDEIMDQELERLEKKRLEEEQEEQTGGWNQVDIDHRPVDIKAEESIVLEEEPSVADGVIAALKLASRKGYLENEGKKTIQNSADFEELQAKNYTIQDKRFDDIDDKSKRRDRYSGGITQDFKDKEGYRPEIKLDYVDDAGRQLSAKEAFRQLSHRFHGKGSGKKKTEKRSKKVDEELLMAKMSSTDTPLNTLSLLQDKQRSEQSPFIVLSGGSRGLTANSIVKQS